MSFRKVIGLDDQRRTVISFEAELNGLGHYNNEAITIMQPSQDGLSAASVNIKRGIGMNFDFDDLLNSLLDIRAELEQACDTARHDEEEILTAEDFTEPSDPVGFFDPK